MWALGLMSGTSADGIDAALIQTDGYTIKAFGPTHFEPYSPDVKQMIMNAYGRPPKDDSYKLDRIITEQHAEVVKALLGKTDIKPEVIGFHGQTIYHKPPQKNECGQTHQLGDGELLASLIGIRVVDRFRVNDVAHGGQGAPLVPLFHQALTQGFPKPIAVLNIGGVANVTWLGSSEDDLLAFDTGPGNGLIDDWVFQHKGLAWDENGAFAAAGMIDEELLKRWLSLPYFDQKPPKSLDRKTFQTCLEDVSSMSFEDGVATLTAFTAAAIVQGMSYFPVKPKLWIVAGGGAHNQTLMTMMKTRIATPVKMASELNWYNDALEAQAFGYLAVRSVRGLPLSLPGTTGVPYPLSGGRQCSVLSVQKN